MISKTKYKKTEIDYTADDFRRTSLVFISWVSTKLFLRKANAPDLD